MIRAPLTFEQLFAAGMAEIQRGNYAQALPQMQAALHLRPDHADARYNVARLHEALGQMQEALAAYDACLVQQPQWPAVWNNRGNVLRALGQSAAALASFRQCLAIDPGVSTFVLPNIGQTQIDQRDFQGALQTFEAALALSPGDGNLWFRAGHCLRELRRFDAAKEAFEKALQCHPEHDDARLALAHLCFEMLDFQGTSAALEQLHARHPLDSGVWWTRLVLRVPPIVQSAEEANDSRQALARALAEFEQVRRANPGRRWDDGAVPKTLFYLAYQEQNNQELLARFGALAVEAMQPVSSGLPRVAPLHVGGRKIRVGIVSEYFRAHSVWEALIKGWLRHLDRHRFELHLFHLDRTEDAETDYARAHSERMIPCPPDLQACAVVIAGERMDVLLYPDAGISAKSYRLACLRLAPRQFASWGHPETSGLSTLDGFLSADAFEPADAQSHYTEPLIRLPHLGCCLESASLTPDAPDLDALGLRGTGPLLVCGGTPFKYGPGFDALLVQVAQRVRDARFVFFDYAANPWYSNAVKHRLTQAFLGAGLDPARHLHWVPWLAGGQFMGLMQQADVLLDSIGFSGFNTAAQALSCNLPVVAWEGRFLRGRLASGLMGFLDMPELVASTALAYVDAIEKLVTDRSWHAAIQARIQTALPRMFQDVAPIRALEDLLQAPHLG